MPMRNKLKYGLILFLLLIAAACNSDLVIDVPEPDDRIVIDGYIEQGLQAKVMLTANSPYFSVIDSASLRNLVLTRAKVSLSNGDTSETLILRKDKDYFPPYYYQGNIILGETGHTYTLTAEYGGKTAWATTTIPEPVKIDTSWFGLAEGEDSLGIIYLGFTDPGDVKNYYRIFTKRLGKDNKYISTLIMAIDDQYFQGNYTEFSLYRAPESYLETGDNSYFTLGDTVIIKLCTMDKSQYDFWSSFQAEVLNANNPFASAVSNLRSNVEGDGMGIWGGYGASYDTVYALQ
jgi:hypothetical protein